MMCSPTSANKQGQLRRDNGGGWASHFRRPIAAVGSTRLNENVSDKRAATARSANHTPPRSSNKKVAAAIIANSPAHLV